MIKQREQFKDPQTGISYYTDEISSDFWSSIEYKENAMAEYTSWVTDTLSEIKTYPKSKNRHLMRLEILRNDAATFKNLFY